MDFILTPLVLNVLGRVAQDWITDACKDYFKDKFKALFGRLETLGEQDKVELAYRAALQQAYATCLEILLHDLKMYYNEDELKRYGPSLEAFIKDPRVTGELAQAVRNPNNVARPSPDLLTERWKIVSQQSLPAPKTWHRVAYAFRHQALKQNIMSDDLRAILDTQNLQALRTEIARQGGVRVQVRRDKYSRRMRTKFAPVDLANLMPAYADDPGRMVIRDVFVPQQVRENPPPVEIPKDLVERLRHNETDDEAVAWLRDERELARPMSIKPRNRCWM